MGDVLDLLVLSKVVLLNTSFFHNPLNDFPFLGFLGDSRCSLGIRGGFDSLSL